MTVNTTAITLWDHILVAAMMDTFLIGMDYNAMVRKYVMYQSYYCSCFPLLDIDECSLQLDECEQVCVNLDGSYTCECYEGYAIVSNRYYTCEGKPCRYYMH